MASGSPSRRRQISATAPVSASTASASGRTAFARSANRRCACSGTSGSTGRTDSPGTPRGSRLVARIVSPGQWVRRVSARAAAAPMTCSQLSRIRSWLRGAQYSISRATGSACGVASSLVSSTVSRRPRALTTAPGTASGWSSGASSTSHAWGSPAAASSARRVFPEPPGPVSVTRRALCTSERMASSSGSRPTKDVRRGRRLPVRSGGREGGAALRVSGWVGGACCSSNDACRALSSGPGSAPRVSARVRRADSYAARASAGRPVSRRARMRRACRGSSSGWAAVSSVSSGTTSGARPSSRAAAARVWVAARRRASGRVAAVRSGRSARAGPCQRARASVSVRWAVAGSPAVRALVPVWVRRSKTYRSMSSSVASRR